MNFSNWILNQKRLLIVMTVFMTVMGIASLPLVPKAEDPVLPNWFSNITVILPGGSPDQIDIQISKRLNDRLKEMDELKTVETTIRPEVMVMQLEMKDSLRNTEEVWDKVRNILNEEKVNFPKGTLEPEFFTNTNDIQTILLTVYGGTEEELYRYAKQMKEDLLLVSGTSKVVLHGDPKLEMQIQLDPQKLKERSISNGQVAQALTQANQGLPGGAMDVGGRRIQVQTNSRFTEKIDIAQVYLQQGSGDPLPLGQVSQIDYQPREIENLSRFNGQRAMFLGLVAQHPIEIVEYGQRVRQQIEKTKTKLAKDSSFSSHIKSQEVSFNPDRTQERLKDLAINLVIGILTVGLILWVWMGWRIALVVSAFVPIISLVGFNLFALSGGILHQISLAAFVISLGQFIDNIIVIVESMQKKINSGDTPFGAASKVVQEFSKPMFFATGTNIAAFIPMLLSSGATAEFTYTIPFVAILTLLCAWILALLVVPLISSMVLTKSSQQGDEKFQLGLKIGKFVAQKTYLVLGLAFIILLSTSTGFIWVKKQFFPSADRNQLLVSIELMDGSSIHETDKVTQQIEQFLLVKPEISSVSSFIGTEVPRFYYNVGFPDWGRNRARLLVTTKDKSNNKMIQQQIEEFANQNILSAKVMTESLEQGPPILAPVEYRIFSDDLSALEEISAKIEKELTGLQSLRNVRTDLGSGLLYTSAQLDQNLGARFGIDTNHFALDLLSSSRGAEIGKMYLNGDLIDIKLRISKSSQQDAYAALKNTVVGQSEYRKLAIEDLSHFQVGFMPASIFRYNGERLVRVLAWPKPGQDLTESKKAIESLLKANPDWQQKAKIIQGGEAEGSDEANMAIMKTVPIGIFILILCLLLEFNSLRKVFIIMLSVPFVIAGVTPGLLIGNAAFGFMSLLGVLALVGIVVNNSILLIESLDEQIEKGFDLDEAIQNALETRVRPILMTALTTIAGLLPMAFEDSTLWPPLALAMISGLFGSTMITIFFVPALYKFFFSNKSSQHSRPMNSGIASWIILLFAVSTISLNPEKSLAQDLTLSEILYRAEQSASYRSFNYQHESIEELRKVQLKDAFAPKLGLEVSQMERLSQLTQTNGFGTFDYGKNRQTLGVIELSVPLFEPTKMFGDRKALAHQEQASEANKVWMQNEIKNKVLNHLIDLLMLDQGLQSLERIENRLKEIQKNAQRFALIGSSGDSDLLMVEMAISENKIQQEKLQQQKKTLLGQINVYVEGFLGLQDQKKLRTELEQFINSSERKTAKSERYDLRSLELAGQAQEDKVQSVKDGYLPSIEAKGRYLVADQGLLDQKQWSEVGLTLKWALYEGGTRSSLVSSENAKAMALRSQWEHAKRSVQIEHQQLEEKLSINQLSIQESKQNIELAIRAASQDKNNALRGKIQLRHWLESEVRLEQIKLNFELALLENYQHRINLIKSQGGLH